MTLQDRNHWLDPECASAFWDQHLALPYQQLLQDTARWLHPVAGERWLDLGCGRGELTGVLWRAARGQLAELVAVDCNELNEQAIARLRRKLTPPATETQIRFQTGNFSEGLPQFPDASFDGIVSGLAISYAESRDPATGKYTDAAYRRLIEDLYRILKPGGRVVFSVNVPEPRFWKIFWKSLRFGLRVSKPAKSLVNAWKMQRYGGWLKREARRGRFHFLPIEEISAHLTRVGFKGLQHTLSYADQAYVVRASKTAASSSRVA